MNEVVVRFCPHTKSLALAELVGDITEDNILCLHNEDLAKDIDDVKAWLQRKGLKSEKVPTTGNYFAKVRALRNEMEHKISRIAKDLNGITGLDIDCDIIVDGWDGCQLDRIHITEISPLGEIIADDRNCWLCDLPIEDLALILEEIEN